MEVMSVCVFSKNSLTSDFLDLFDKLDELYAQLEAVTHHEHFCKAPEQC